jgi:cyanosortase A-associated protein
MPASKTLQTIFFSITLGGVFYVLNTVATAPARTSSDTTARVLPQEVPLTGWQASPLNSRPRLNPDAQPNNLVASEAYQYRKNDVLLDIQMRYLVNTEGDITKLTERYSGLSHTSLSMRHVDDSFYQLETDQNRAYLNTCIISDGSSVVTSAQFRQKQSVQNSSPARIAQWAIGRVHIQDRRCLWAELSIPLDTLSQQEAYHVLEDAWFDWKDAWRSQFPSM